jgi:hypothetical protein
MSVRVILIFHQKCIEYSIVHAFEPLVAEIDENSKPNQS